MFTTKASNGNNNIIGKKLRRIRREKNLSQEKLACIFQLQGFEADRHVIRRIENGKRFVTDIELLLILQALSVSLDELI